MPQRRDNHTFSFNYFNRLIICFWLSIVMGIIMLVVLGMMPIIGVFYMLEKGLLYLVHKLNVILVYIRFNLVTEVEYQGQKAFIGPSPAYYRKSM